MDIRKMKLIISIFIFFASCLCVAKELTDSNIIYWSEKLKLTWSYYLGKPNNYKVYSAISSCGIEAKISSIEGDTAFIEIAARFNKVKSWVKNNAQTKEVLNHEQGHFDLTEVYSRKLRSQLAGVIFSEENLNSTLKNYVDKNYIELITAQEKYDLETNFSNDTSNQSKWDKRIIDELDQLVEFNNPVVKAYIKSIQNRK
jgi:hypothetical protein